MEMTMSDDLVQRLKDTSLEALSFESHELWHEAADEIARLTAELAAERDARERLEAICQRWLALDGGDWHIMRHAREKDELKDDTRAAIGGSA
jgi:hypothetical protein